MADSATKVRAQVIEGFAAVLSQLRDEAGRPSFRTMAGRSKAISHTTLHEAVQGNRLPSWGTTAEFVRACGADPREYRERWEQANRIVGSATALDPTGPPSGPQSRAGTTDSPAAPDPREPPSDAVLGGAPHGRAPSRRRWAWVVGVAAVGLLVAGGAATWAVVGRDKNSPSSSSTQTSPQTAVVHSAAECPVRQQNPGSQPPAHEGDDVAFVDDVTLPDCTLVARGQSVQ